MQPKLWVDYTNHRGERSWREIESIMSVGIALYPPTAPVDTRKWMPCLFVKLADRGTTRTLALTSCHAFYQGDVPPYNAQIAAQVADRQTIDELRNVVQNLTDSYNRVARHLAHYQRNLRIIGEYVTLIEPQQATSGDDRVPLQATVVDNTATPAEEAAEAIEEEMSVLDRLEAIEATLGI